MERSMGVKVDVAAQADFMEIRSSSFGYCMLIGPIMANPGGSHAVHLVWYFALNAIYFDIELEYWVYNLII